MKRKAQRKAGRKNRNRPVRRKIAFRDKAPTTARQYFSKSRKFQETWDSVAHVISKMRSGRTSLRKAAREFGIEPNQVIRLGRSALKKQKNGRYAARKTDRVLRMLGVLTVDGKREIAVRDSRQASVIGSHWDAVQRYWQTGDDSALPQFHGKKITDASRKRHLLLTDLDELDRLGSAGVLSFESLYGRSV
jgi:hypothetical protein